MAEPLVRRADPQGRGEIVGADVHRAAAPARRLHQREDAQPAVQRHQRRRRLHHQLERDRPRGPPEPVLQRLGRAAEQLHLDGQHHLRRGEGEAGDGLAELGAHALQRAERTPRGPPGEGLQPDADERRKRSVAATLLQGHARGLGVVVLLLVGPDAVAVLEVDPEVLHRLALQLGDDPLAEVGRLGRAERQSEGVRERRTVRRVGVQRGAGQHPQASRRAGLEQMRAAVQHLDRASPGRAGAVARARAGEAPRRAIPAGAAEASVSGGSAMAAPYHHRGGELPTLNEGAVHGT